MALLDGDSHSYDNKNGLERNTFVELSNENVVLFQLIWWISNFVSLRDYS